MKLKKIISYISIFTIGIYSPSLLWSDGEYNYWYCRKLEIGALKCVFEFIKSKITNKKPQYVWFGNMSKVMIDEIEKSKNS